MADIITRRKGTMRRMRAERRPVEEWNSFYILSARRGKALFRSCQPRLLLFIKRRARQMPGSIAALRAARARMPYAVIPF